MIILFDVELYFLPRTRMSHWLEVEINERKNEEIFLLVTLCHLYLIHFHSEILQPNEMRLFTSTTMKAK